MTTRMLPLPLLLALSLVVAGSTTADDEKKATLGAGELIVTDANGKEQKVTKYTFSAGTRRLGWLAAGGAGEKEKGPEALVLRDAAEFGLRKGVLAYVPLDRVRSITFDNKKQTMSVRVATSGSADDDVTLTGSTEYEGINKITLRAEVDRGDDGVAALTYQGGTPRGVRAIRFPAPKSPPAAAEKGGRPAVVRSADKSYKRTDRVTDLQPLYDLGGGQDKLAALLMFRKTLKVDVAKVKKITAGEKEADGLVWNVEKKDGDESPLTLLETATIDGKKATLQGLLGKTTTGYRFFPVAQITAIDFDTTEVPEEKKKAKEEKEKFDTP